MRKVQVTSKKANTQVNGITGFASLYSHQEYVKGRSSLETEGIEILLKENKLVYSGIIYTTKLFQSEIKVTIFKNNMVGLVEQWLRICLPVQGTQFEPRSGRIPHAAEQLSPCSQEPTCCNY